MYGTAQGRPKLLRIRKRRWWQPKPTDAEVLLGAINVLDQRGWAKGAWVDPSTGSVCLLGAIGISALESGRKVRLYEKASLATRSLVASENIVGRSNHWWHFNDRAMNVEQVKLKLRRMATKAEANGGKFPKKDHYVRPLP